MLFVTLDSQFNLSTMRTISLIFLICFANITMAQENRTTHKGQVDFEASVPLFEEVKAKNEKAICILNPENGEISSTIYIKDFHFKIPLMEKHFNENYLESDSHPKATFKGIIENFDWNSIDTSPKEFNLKGILKIHGKSRKINTVTTLKKSNSGLEIITNFTVNSKDFDIKIPEILRMKVAETVNINSYFLLK